MEVSTDDGKWFCIEENKFKCWTDRRMSLYLNISLEQYHDILVNNGATMKKTLGEVKFCVFKNREDAEKTIEILEPYLIMKELMK